MGVASFINAVATATPDHDIHQPFVAWAEEQIDDPRTRAVFARMARQAGILHRFSVLPRGKVGGSPVSDGGFYAPGFPGTAARMRVYAKAAPELAMQAALKLAERDDLSSVSHLVVASCTGFVAPGIDQILAGRLGLRPDVERTLVGFMGCYAAISALRVAHHIVRSVPAARVLVVTVELSTLHLQAAQKLEPLLAMLQFGDGAAAALVSSEPRGFGLAGQFSVTLPESSKLIEWTIGDTGFDMTLSGEVPARIAAALADEATRSLLLGDSAVDVIDSWAVHAGGRSILDAVERALGLAPEALAASRDILARFGNMSSSTLLFVLETLLARPGLKRGIALAFGPGLAAEGFRFERAGR